MIITIDGPAASGKSSAARSLAKQLGFFYIDSGLLYRALAYLLIHEKGYQVTSVADPKESDIIDLLDPTRFVYRYDDQSAERVFFDNADIAPHLKSNFISEGASIVSQNKRVRELLTNVQRKLAHTGTNLVIDGRDSGSIVFPEAEVKVYLTASVPERALRWCALQRKRGVVVTQQEAEHMIQERDARDMNRAIAPLVIPKDAFIVDNTGLDQKQTINALLKIIHQTPQKRREAP